MIRVVVADDHPVFREGLAAVLTSAGDIEVVDQCSDGTAVVAAVASRLVDVVLMDLKMPEMDGVAATRAVAASGVSTKVLMLTMNEDDESLLAAVRAGARGYLLKEASSEDICRAIRAVARGEVVFGSGVAPKMMALMSATTRTKVFAQLSDREHEILELIAAGTDNPGIAKRLFISDKTVRNNVSNVMLKLQVASRAALVAKARDAGVGTES